MLTINESWHSETFPSFSTFSTHPDSPNFSSLFVIGLSFSLEQEDYRILIDKSLLYLLMFLLPLVLSFATEYSEVMDVISFWWEQSDDSSCWPNLISHYSHVQCSMTCFSFHPLIHMNREERRKNNQPQQFVLLLYNFDHNTFFDLYQTMYQVFPIPSWFYLKLF